MTKLTWKRSKPRQTIVARHRIYDSKCGRYRIVNWHSDLGGEKHYPDKWVSIVLTPRERILGEHRSRSAAEKNCNKHARENEN